MSNYAQAFSTISAAYDADRARIEEKYSTAVAEAHASYDHAQEEARAEHSRAIEEASKERRQSRRAARDRFLAGGHGLTYHPAPLEKPPAHTVDSKYRAEIRELSAVTNGREP